MALLTPNGALETLADGTQRVVSSNTGTWADLTSWQTWSSYQTSPATLNWLSEPLDFGVVDTFTLSITADCVGVVTYTVYTSNTGVFGGEETTTVVNEGDTDVPAFTGRYAIIGITVDGAGVAPAINSFDYRASTERLNFALNNIQSSELSGTNAARTLVLPQTVSAVTNIQITAHVEDLYFADSYIAAEYTEENASLLVGGIVSKDRNNPQITLRNLSGTASAGVFDAIVAALPQQYMLGKNLTLR